MESRRCLPLVDYSDDRPPSPAPADPADYHRRVNFNFNSINFHFKLINFEF
jgi:hypothetical protein